MTSLAHRVILLSGWRRALVASLAGAAAALAMPPFGLFPALALGLTLAVWLLDGAARGGGGRVRLLPTLGAAAVDGWFWGFGYLLAGLWWLGAAFLVEADQFAYLLPLGVLGLPAVLALFFAFGFALARLAWSPGAHRVVALAVALTVSEWLRGHLFTGFPWNALGLALGQDARLMQGASLVGLWGLTLLAVLIGAAPAMIGTGPTARERWQAPLLAAALLGLLAGFGAWRLPADASPTVAGVRLRLMQPNLPQDAKFRPENGPEILGRYLALSDRATGPGRSGVADVTHLVWPESAFPFLLEREPQALRRIADLLPPGTLLLTGAARAEEGPPGDGARYFNAIQVVAEDGTLRGRYDKVHLVPFGEYFPEPLDRLLRSLGLRQFVHVPGGFAAGAPGLALDVPGLPPVAATICYEAIFPSAVVPRGGARRPGLILNVTNDAWFGLTPGPHQHFAQARLRAVEEGLPLVRAANSGISAVVDPYGRPLAMLPLGVEGVADAALPQALPATVFPRLGNILLAGMVLWSLVVALAGLRGPARSRASGGTAQAAPAARRVSGAGA